MKSFSNFLIKNRIVILLIWVIVIAVSILNVAFNKNSFEAGIGEINNSISKEVNDNLKSNFKEKFSSNLILVISGTKEFKSNPEMKGRNILRPYEENIINHLENTLNKRREIKSVITQFNSPVSELISKDKRTVVFLIQLKNPDFSFAEGFVPKLRQITDIVLESHLKNEPDLKIYVTGNAAFSYDMNIISEKEGKESEKKVLVLSFLVLIFAFRSITASLIAVVAGFSSSIIAISLLKIITGYLSLSLFCQNVSTMIGLGLGIDYSLLLITRYREEREKFPAEEAIFNTLKTAGLSVMYSGVTILIGFLALFIPNLKLTNSIAFGGTLVVLFSILTALVFTPIMLYICAKIIDFPKFLEVFNFKNKGFSKNWAIFLVKHSLKATILSLFILLVISYPVLKIKLSDPEIRTMPDSMESKQGFYQLQKISSGNVMFPIYILVKSERNIIGTENLIALSDLTEQLKKDKRISQIFSLVTFKKEFGPLQYTYLYNSEIEIPEIKFVKSILLSNDGKSTLLQVLPAKNLHSYEINKLIDTLRKIKYKGFDLKVGGPASVSHDLIARLYQSFPLIICVVYLITMVLLIYAFKSLLIPLKAIVVNTISLLSCYGILVLIFQYGWFSQIINLKYSPESILSGIPVILFCIMFSLSMDYEVFLLSRIHETYLKTGDNEASIITGLTETSGVITKAALIMLIVFGAFTQADIIMIKMLGVGLATAVFIDATLIRLILVPAFMKLAGKANWYFPFLTHPLYDEKRKVNKNL